MTKILYISYVNNKPINAGVNQKISDQIQFFKDNGINCTLISLDVNYVSIIDNNLSKKLIPVSFIKRRKFTLIINQYISKYSYDVIYIRYQFSDPFIAKTINKISKSNKKLIIEVPTYPYNSELVLQGIKGYIKLAVDLLFKRRVLGKANRIVTFSDHSEICKVRTINTRNGVNIHKLPLRSMMIHESINLIAVSTMKPWHGYDRLIEGMNMYYNHEMINEKNKTIVTLKLVGDGVEINKYKKLVDDYKLNSYIKFEGILTDERLNNCFNTCDIAVSSLGLHRINLKAASTLKSREYGIRGFPIITSAIEGVGFDEKYILQCLPNDEYISIEKIVEFYNRVYNESTFNPNRLRLDVINLNSYEITMKPIYDYIKGETND